MARPGTVGSSCLVLIEALDYSIRPANVCTYENSVDFDGGYRGMTGRVVG